MRVGGWVLALACGCNRVLGLSPPVEQRDAAIDASDPDFALAVTGATRVPAGSFDLYTITITPTAGFDAAVDVTIASPPTGVTPVPVTIAAGQTTAQLQVTGSPSLVIGTELQLDVFAQGGGRDHEQTVSVVVTGVPGTIDSGFGSGGVDQFSGFLNAGLVLGDDDIVVAGDAGSAEHQTITRLTAQGVVDVTFGVDGSFVSQPTTLTSTEAMVLAPDGDLVTAFSVFETNPTVSKVTAVLASGANDDPTFGSGGTVALSGNVDSPTIAVQSDGRVLTSGFPTTDVVRLLPDGSADPSWLVATLPSSPQQIGLGSNDEVFAINTVQGPGSGGTSNAFAAERLTGSGALDTSYGSNGVATFDFGLECATQAFVTLADGSVVIAGEAFEPSNLQMVAVKLGPDGTPDATFGSGGAVVVPTSGHTFANAVAVQADGRIVVVGNQIGSSPLAAVVARLLPDGSLDPTFGSAGVAFVEPNGAEVFFQSIGVQSNGEIVLVGGEEGAGAPGFVTRIWF